MSAVRAAVPERPDPAIGSALVPRLAEAARMAAAPPAPERVTASATEHGRRPRRALVARIAVALSLLVFSTVGLAIAGVKLPAPARSVFESIGINLPNQEVNAGPSRRGKSAAAHKRALERRARRDAAKRGKALGHDRGKATGLRGGTSPGQQSRPSGPPPHSNAGGNGQGTGSSGPGNGKGNSGKSSK